MPLSLNRFERSFLRTMTREVLSRPISRFIRAILSHNPPRPFSQGNLSASPSFTLEVFPCNTLASMSDTQNLFQFTLCISYGRLLSNAYIRAAASRGQFDFFCCGTICPFYVPTKFLSYSPLPALSLLYIYLYLYICTFAKQKRQR